MCNECQNRRYRSTHTHAYHPVVLLRLDKHQTLILRVYYFDLFSRVYILFGLVFAIILMPAWFLASEGSRGATTSAMTSPATNTGGMEAPRKVYQPLRETYSSRQQISLCAIIFRVAVCSTTTVIAAVYSAIQHSRAVSIGIVITIIVIFLVVLVFFITTMPFLALLLLPVNGDVPVPYS